MPGTIEDGEHKNKMAIRNRLSGQPLCRILVVFLLRGRYRITPLTGSELFLNGWVGTLGFVPASVVSGNHSEDESDNERHGAA